MTNTKIEAIFARLAEENRLSAEEVLREATNPSSPLHSRFEWDDSAAAHQHRLEQARSLIRSVRVPSSFQPFLASAPRYVRNPDRERIGAYVPIESLRDNEARARAVVVRELRAVIAAIERARSIASELNLVEELDELLRRTLATVERARGTTEQRL